MRDRPAGLDERDLTAALSEGWAVEARATAYLPVGAGAYHWSVTDSRAAVWFVKVDDLGADDAGRERAFDQIRRSLTTARALHDAGLGFVLAPVPARDGAALSRLTPRYALSVFPMVDGTAGRFGPHRREDLAEMVGMLAELHRTTAVVADVAPRADLRLPGRDRLSEALRDLGRPWTGGPYAEPARRLLALHAARVRRWLADFDRLVHEVRGTATAWVVTHGEPHPGNVIRTSGGLRLIDWGTAQIAPPERDLWMLTTAFTSLIGADPIGVDDEALADYGRAAGRTATPAGIALYRRWWALADVAAFTDDLRRPHGDGEDAAAALSHLTGYLETAID
jgi:spectinomycin phosphotransferase